MDTGGEGLNVYADAKTEYTRQLSQYCLTAYLRYFLNLFEETKDSNEPRKLLISFQGSLKNISEWSYETVSRETSKLLKDINCDYFDDLLSAVFVAHTKVLSAIRLSTKQKKLQITIPKVEHFLHHTLIECARILWSNVFLFSPSGSSIDRQKNLRSTEQLIHEGILQSIRSMLPVKNILKEYLKDDGDDEEAVEEKSVVETKSSSKISKSAIETESSNLEVTSTESLDLESTKPESIELESTKPELIELESTKPESMELESMELESMELESTKPESTKPELISLRLMDLESTESESTKLESTESEPMKLKSDNKKLVIKEVPKEIEDTKNSKPSKKERTKIQTTPATPTIEIETEPSVQFSSVNTVFDYENTSNDDIEDDEDDEALIQVLDTEGVEVNEFEELEKTTPIEFEEL